MYKQIFISVSSKYRKYATRNNYIVYGIFYYVNNHLQTRITSDMFTCYHRVKIGFNDVKLENLNLVQP